MPSMYPGVPLADWRPEDGMPCMENPTVANVPLDFGRLRTVGEYLAVRDQGRIPGRKYTDTQVGDTEARMHFQGIQRLGPPNDNVLVLTGGDAADRVSHLFVCQMGSRRKDRPWAPWGTNLRFSRKPPVEDELVKIYALDHRMWHAGGMSVLGDVLAIPLEDDAAGDSAVIFVDVTEPLDARMFPPPLRIDRPAEVGKAGGVALTRLPNHHYLCAVWTDSDHLPRRLDLYLSVDTNLLHGFRPDFLSWHYDRLLPAGGPLAAWQTVSFVTQSEGALYLVGTENTSNTAPYVRGTDRVDLLHVEFPPATTHDVSPVLTLPTVTRVAEKAVLCERDFANLDAAAGIYLAPDWSHAGEPHAHLLLYAAYHWRIARCIRFIEFAQDVPATAQAIHDIEDAWIDLYEHPNFRGQRLSITGLQDAEIRDYGSIYVQDCGFSDRVSSVRYQLPPGFVYRLYRDDGFRPRNSHNLPLVGDGLVHEIRDLHVEERFDNAVSSSRYD